MKLYIGLAAYLLFVVYLPIVLTGLGILFKKLKPWRTRLWAVPLYLVVAYAIPLGDVTWHSWNMAKVCPNAGLHVYRTVVVDGFYGRYAGYDTMKELGYLFVETSESPGIRGYIRFERKNDEVVVLHKFPRITADWEIVDDRFDYPDHVLGVTVDRTIVRNRRTSEVIAEYVSYGAWRGWLDAWIASVIDDSPGVCYRTPKLIDKFPEILIPSGAKK